MKKVIICRSGVGTVHYMLDWGEWKYSTFGTQNIRELRKLIGNEDIEWVPCTFVDGTKLDMDIVDKYKNYYYTRFVVDPDVDEIIDKIKDNDIKGDFKLLYSNNGYLYMDSIYETIMHIMFYYDIHNIRKVMRRILRDIESGKFKNLSKEYYIGKGTATYDGSVETMRIVSC